MFDFVIFTHVPHKVYEGKLYAYGPYVWEMNLWLKRHNTCAVVAPILAEKPMRDELPYETKITLFRIPSFNLRSLKNIFISLFVVPFCFIRCFWAMVRSKELHIRCPGNVGLIAMCLQTLFPWKKKTIKYAGCWPSYKKEPLTYKLQKALISNRIFTKRAKALVYGNWSPKNQNLLPAFTATYPEADKVEHKVDFNPPFVILFIGRFNENKGCLVVVQSVLELLKRNLPVRLKMIGDGPLYDVVLKKIKDRPEVELLGKLDREEVKNQLKRSHFLLAPSLTEGWPKTVAEALFWGVIPMVTDISCVKEMLGNGQRGIIVPRDCQAISQKFQEICQDKWLLENLSKNGMNWSRQFTLETFDTFIGEIYA